MASKKKRPNSLYLYKERAGAAIESFKQNPVLLLPDFILFLITYFLTIAFYRFSGLADIVRLIMENGSKADLAKSLLAGNIGQFAFSLAIFIFVTFFFGVGAEAVKFSLIKQVVLKNKADLAEAWRRKYRFFWSIVGMKIIIYLIMAGAILIVSLLSAMTYAIGPNIGGFSLGWVTMVLALVLFLFFTLGLLFRYAILFFEGKSAAKTIKKSFLYLKNNTKHVFLVWLIITFVALLTGILATLASSILAKLQALVSPVALIYLFSFLTSLAAFAIRLLYLIWSQLFVFDSYAKTKEILK